MISFRSVRFCNNIISNIYKTNFICIGHNSLKNISNDHTKNKFFSNKFWAAASSFHTSVHLRDISGLNEFFDNPKNWGAQEVKVGRSWKKEELRLKSNEDLHKLWYVLLKEKNMLLTMEAASKEEYKLFPNPERIDKVEESMNHLEAVVRERDNAYMLLETGESGERPSGSVVDSFGRRMHRRFKEHLVPDYMHSRVTNTPFNRNPIRTPFSRLLREKATRVERFRKVMRIKHVARIFREIPDVDIDALKQKFPDLDVDKIRSFEMSRGNHSNNFG